MLENVKETVNKVIDDVKKTTSEAVKTVKFVRDPEGFMVPIWMERKSMAADVK